MKTMLKWGTGIWLSLTIVMAFLYAPEMTRPNMATGGFDAWPSFRIVFFHVPCSWIAFLAFGVSMVASIMYLKRPTVYRDTLAMASNQLGFLFCILATATGMLWAKHDWGAYWNWDPRQTSILILLLIYAGYFLLRSSVSDERKRARLSAVYSIVAFVTVPFLMFVVPRIMFSLHPSPIIETGAEKGSMDSKMKTVFYMALLGFSGVYIWVLGIRTQMESLQRRLQS